VKNLVICKCFLVLIEGRDISVDIATGYGLDGRGSIPGKGQIFLFSTASIPVLGPVQPAIQWVPGPLSPEVKRQGREADHSPPSSAEAKNSAAISPIPNTPSWRFPYLIKHRDSFTFLASIDTSGEM
jgi:hypothetical protein